MKRPFGITVLSLALGWLSFAGLVGTFVFADESVFGSYAVMVGAASFAYGASALATSIGLWKHRSWARSALFVWMGSCVTIMCIVIVSQPIGMFLGGYPALFVFALMVGLVFYGLNAYVSKFIGGAT